MPESHPPSRVEETVEAFLRRHELCQSDKRIVVALSGGPDSVALLLALHEFFNAETAGPQPIAAHLDHGLRGEESADDREFCRELTDALGIPFHSAQRDVGEAAESTGRSLEDAARRCRYRFLANVAEQTDATLIATGHHRDDLAETVLMRIIRGCGIHGLSPFSERGPLPLPNDRGLEVVRPLVQCRREDILDFLSSRGQEYRSDSSNANVGFLRNRIRHRLLPHLQDNYRQFSVDSLAALATSAGEMVSLVGRLADEQWNELVQERKPGELALDAGRLLNLEAAIRKEVLRRAISTISGSPGPPDLSATHLEAADSVLQNSVGAQTSLPHDITARREHGLLYLRRGQQDNSMSPRKLTIGSPLEVPKAGCLICSRFLEGKEAADIDRAAVEDPEQAFLSARKLTLPLTVRGRRSGDTFYPLGAPGHGKLKDFLINRKIPRHRRDALPLVTTGDDEIAWVAGVEIGHLFRLRGGEERVVHLWVDKNGKRGE